MEDVPILLPFIDYTEKFKNAMRNREIPIITEQTSSLMFSAEESNAMVKVAEDEIKGKLRSIDKAWAIAIDKSLEDKSEAWYTIDLYVRVGSKDIYKPFSISSWENDLRFSEKKYETAWTMLYYCFSDNHPRFSHYGLGGWAFLRKTKGRPLKLKEWFDRKSNKEFW